MTPDPAPGRRSGGSQRPPAALSRWAKDVWTSLLDRYEFGDHELIVFEKALRSWDLADRWLRESEAATGREQARLVKQSLDAGQQALRCWRVLKFDTGQPTRRPGRPADARWSTIRGAGATHAN